MKDWWHQLIPRERIALGLGALALGLFILYQWFWAPLQQDVLRAQAVRERLDQDYTWMHRAAREVAGYQANSAGDVVADSQPRRSLLVEVDESLKRAGLANALEEIKPDGSQLLRVELRNVAFDQVTPWLGYLYKRGIQVTSSVINRIDDTPRVNLRLTLESKAG